ncbi:hypothetical protein EXN66_Car016195 [Channa argus]|uniref:Uncharacterized protein n=1 Tax=Channa argus TaxID=215402 RepID=A0A6G1QE36_CHAAH|nr:hypothetical protein EXN66_Car016195 [Channa argus]
MLTAQSRKASLSLPVPPASSPVNLMLMSTAPMWPVKACTSWILTFTQVSSTYVNQVVGAVPGKELSTFFFTASMCRLATIGDTGETSHLCK